MKNTKFNHSKKIIVLLITMSFLISVTAAVVSAKDEAKATRGSIYTTDDSAKTYRSAHSSNSAIAETISTSATPATSNSVGASQSTTGGSAQTYQSAQSSNSAIAGATSTITTPATSDSVDASQSVVIRQ